MPNLFFDVETTGLPKKKLPFSDPSQPVIVQFAGILCDEDRIYNAINFVVDVGETVIPDVVVAIHGVDNVMSTKTGINESTMVYMFADLVTKADKIICHNVKFDSFLMMGSISRCMGDDYALLLFNKPTYCTMEGTTDIVQLPAKWGYKFPKLNELHVFLFGHEFEGAHDAFTDVLATRKCYYELVRRGLING